jgi:predicted acetyltransferase
MSLEVRPLASGDEGPLLDILERSFHIGPERWQLFLRRLGGDAMRVARRGRDVVGGFGWYRMGQYWGGKRVPMWGVAAVGVAPEQRERGIGASMMAAALEEARAAGVPLCALHPATVPPYRRVGYEQAGVYARLVLDAGEAVGAGEPELTITRLPLVERKSVEPIYQRWAAAHDGHLDRIGALWERIAEPWSGNRVDCYLFGPPRAPEGYIAFAQERDGWRYALEIKDWVALTPAAVRTAWSFLAGHRSLATQFRWHGLSHDSRAALLPEWNLQVAWQRVWMLRVVDVAAALGARGFSPYVSGELHLEVTDDVIAANTGRWVLRVADGAGTVERGGRGDVVLDIRGLAPLYSGYLSASRLARLGWLRAAEPRALALADALFAGPTPFLPDMF